MLLLAVSLGTVVGKYFYQETNAKTVFQDEKLIFLQQGVYTNKENMEENSRRIDPKIVVEENEKYYVYVGITGDEKNAQKLKEIYQNQGYEIYEKKVDVSNQEFKSNLDQFDLLLSKTNKEEELLSINEVILANYEQILQKS